MNIRRDEIPIVREGESAGGGSGILSEDRVAYPGHDCANGQECLLDSHCDGKVRVLIAPLTVFEVREKKKALQQQSKP